MSDNTSIALCHEQTKAAAKPLQKASQRYDYLDSIRGIAAFAVVLCHCWLLVPLSFRMEHKGLANVHSVMELFYYLLSKMEESGRSAVMIFFVLSGFVLALSLMARPTSFSSFAVKRVFRIYPAFFVVMLATYALHLSIGVRHENISNWFSTAVHADLSLHSLAKHLFLSGLKGSHDLNGVIWTLVHEMRISLIFPIMLAFIRKTGWKSLIVLLLLSVASSAAILHLTGSVAKGFEQETIWESLLESCFFMPFFGVGAYIAIEKEQIISWLRSLRWHAKVPYCLVMIYFLIKTDYAAQTLLGSLVDYLRGIGAVMLIILALGSARLGNALGHAVALWLGRISYSLYLVHMPIMYVVIQCFGETWPVLQSCLVFVPLSFLIAHILSKWVEYPFMDLGKKIAARLERVPA